MQGRVSPNRTRFRAYQLGCPGSSFSYYANGYFTLIEAMATVSNQSEILEELAHCGKSAVDCLHITSWDNDHCSVSGLEWILEKLSPALIETPGYPGSSACAKESAQLIQEYRRRRAARQVDVKVRVIDPPYVNSLQAGTQWAYRDIVYHPKQLLELDNDNSTIKLFRTGSFNVLSLGDVQDHDIAAMLMRCSTLKREVDVLILAHHGADNGFTSKTFLEKLSPQVAIATCDVGNRHDHPRDAVVDMVQGEGIPLFTTKTGDIIIESIGGHTRDFRVANIHHGRIGSDLELKSKKFHYLTMNQDSQRNLRHPGFKGLR